MTRGEKIGLIVAVLGGVYLIFVDSSSGKQSQRQTIPARTIERVMGYAGAMLYYGAEQGVDPALIASVMTVESGGVASATGAAGEVGLMQIMPSTAAWLAPVSIEELRDTSANIRIGAEYLGYCIKRKGGNVFAGIAGYNYGPDRVQVSGNKVIVPGVVLEYATQVTALVPEYQRLFRERLGSFYMNAFPG